jgi:hypothetical protein
MVERASPRGRHAIGRLERGRFVKRRRSKALTHQRPLLARGVDEDEEKPAKAPSSAAKSVSGQREARLAAALRANLRRRKTIVREPKD